MVLWFCGSASIDHCENSYHAIKYDGNSAERSVLPSGETRGLVILLSENLTRCNPHKMGCAMHLIYFKD